MSSTSNGSSRPDAGRRRAVPGLARVARRQIDAVNRRDLERLVGLYADDAVLEFPASPAIQGLDAIRRAYHRYFEEWEERIALTRVVEAGQVVAAEGEVAGRNKSIPARIPGRVPFQRAYRHAFAVFWEFRRGKISRQRVYYDARDLVRQILGP